MADHPNVTLVTQFIAEVLNDGKLELMNELVAENFEYQGPTASVSGRSEYAEFVRTVRTAWREFHVETTALAATTNTVTVDFWLSGIHSTSYLGVPATNRPFRVAGKMIFRLRGQRIISLDASYDTTALLRQLGV